MSGSEVTLGDGLEVLVAVGVAGGGMFKRMFAPGISGKPQLPERKNSTLIPSSSAISPSLSAGMVTYSTQPGGGGQTDVSTGVGVEVGKGVGSPGRKVIGAGGRACVALERGANASSIPPSIKLNVRLPRVIAVKTRVTPRARNNWRRSFMLGLPGGYCSLSCDGRPAPAR